MARRKRPQPRTDLSPPDVLGLKEKTEDELDPRLKHEALEEPGVASEISQRQVKALGHVDGGGRPRGIVAMVKALTGNGWDVLTFWDDVFRGKAEGFSGRERLEASKLLFERGFGRPVDTTILIDATKAEAEAEMRSVPSEVLYDVLARLAPPPGSAVGKLEKNEQAAMPDVLQGVALGKVVDAEFEPLPESSPDTEKDHANAEYIRATQRRRELEEAGLLDPKPRKSGQVIVKHRAPGRKSRVMVQQREPAPEDDE